MPSNKILNCNKCCWRCKGFRPLLRYPRRFTIAKLVSVYLRNICTSICKYKSQKNIVTFLSTEAFTLKTISCRQSKVQTLFTTTKPSETRLTVEEDELLFGEDRPPYPASHRRKSKTGNILKDPKVPLNPLDHSSTDPLINKLRTIREVLTNCPTLWSELAQNCPDKRALLEPVTSGLVDCIFSVSALGQ